MILYAPDGQNSRLWDYFGYVRNADGALVEDGAPACKICGVKVTLEDGSMSSLIKHLQENHDGVLAEVQVHALFTDPALISSPSV